MQTSWPQRAQIVSSHVVPLLLAGVVVVGCASSAAMRRGDEAARLGDWDAAVEYFQEAVQEDPNDATSRLALQRAMRSAADMHATQGRELEAAGNLPAALASYRQASEYDPTNGSLLATVAGLERHIRDQVEASRPPSALQQMEARARESAQPPLLDPASGELLAVEFRNASLSDILDFLGNATGINVTYDQTFQDRTYSVQLVDVTIEEALDQILTATENFYKVLNPRSLIVVPDTPPKRAQYEEQVIRTFFVSHADVTELTTMLVQVVRAPTLAVQPSIVANPAANTITIRATAAIAGVIERLIQTSDKPKAEVVVDVEILEVNRERAREYGLDLSSYSIGAIFSPSGPPSVGGGDGEGGGGLSPFNANTLSGGVSASDFYLAVPSAVINFLETDDETRLVAKPQLRGQEGSELTLNLGDDIPVPSTSFTAIATGGVAVNPLTSFEYRPIGVNLIMTPRVTYDNEIILELEVENSTLGPNINVAGQPLPTFGTRKVNTTLRLRDGESNLLAGLLREEDRRSLRGFPGLLRLPILRQLFSANEESIRQTDIVMLLTPRVVRTHELTQEDVDPIFIGTQQNMGVTGPPPLIAPVTPPAPEVSSGPLVETTPSTAGADATAAGAGQPDISPGVSQTPTYRGSGRRVASPSGEEVQRRRRSVYRADRDQRRLAGLHAESQPDVRPLRAPGQTRSRKGASCVRVTASVTFAQQVDAAAGRIDSGAEPDRDTTGAAGDGLVAPSCSSRSRPAPPRSRPAGSG